MAVIDYSAGPRVSNAGSCQVYTKAAWADAWQQQPNLACEECQWSTAPRFNSAMLRWEMGYVVLPGETEATLFGVFLGRGKFVRVDWECDDGTMLIWTGYIDTAEWPTEEWGTQQLVAYGLDRALAVTPIADAAWRDETDDDPPQPVIRRSQLPLTFNGPDGERSEDPTETDGQIYAFARPDETSPKSWSTRDIVAYLLAYHLPTSNFGIGAIPWTVDGWELLPDWDSPTLQTQGRTLWDCFNELLNPDTQLGFTVGSDGTASYIRVFSHLASPFVVTVDGKTHTLAANPRQHSVNLSPDALTSGRLSDVGGGYDQIIVRGARRQSIATLRYPQLRKGWGSILETSYRVAGSVNTDYGQLTADYKRVRNAAIRARPSLRDVYRRLELDPEWDFTLGTDDAQVLPDNATPRTVRLHGRLPIKPGVEWNANLSPLDFVGSGPGRPAFLYFADPTGISDFVSIAGMAALSDGMGQLAIYDYAIRHVIEGRTIDLHVDGGPQHLIGAHHFTGLPEDKREFSIIDSLIDYQTVGLTLAIEEDRFCEGVFPVVAPTSDVVRRLVVDVGPAYQQIYVVAGTVTDLADDGTERTSDGGYLVDHSPLLQILAQGIARVAIATRKTARWSSRRRISPVAVGDLITHVSGAPVFAPVTSISISARSQKGAAAAAPSQAFELWNGSLDPLGILRHVGVLPE